MSTIFKSVDPLKFVEKRIIPKDDKTFYVAKFHNPQSYENIEIFVSNQVDQSIFEGLNRGSDVVVMLLADEFRGRTSYQLIGLEQSK